VIERRAVEKSSVATVQRRLRRDAKVRLSRTKQSKSKSGCIGLHEPIDVYSEWIDQCQALELNKANPVRNQNVSIICCSVVNVFARLSWWRSLLLTTTTTTKTEKKTAPNELRMNQTNTINQRTKD
jgi:hypothetical protein